MQGKSAGTINISHPVLKKVLSRIRRIMNLSDEQTFKSWSTVLVRQRFNELFRGGVNWHRFNGAHKKP